MTPLDWSRIHTVLLDMDGTLLDLHFDNYFWREHVPRRYAERHGMTVAAAKSVLEPRFRAAEGTLDWYCVDYWSRELDLDIAGLKEEVDHLIQVRPDVVDFLVAARRARKRLALVTNAHGKALTLKLRRTGLGRYLDSIVCAHDLGLPKEHAGFWPKLQRHLPFDPLRTLLVDDSLPVLRAARRYGIAHLLAVRRPDSRGPGRETGEFAAVEHFRDILPHTGPAPPEISK